MSGIVLSGTDLRLPGSVWKCLGLLRIVGDRLRQPRPDRSSNPKRRPMTGGPSKRKDSVGSQNRLLHAFLFFLLFLCLFSIFPFFASDCKVFFLFSFFPLFGRPFGTRTIEGPQLCDTPPLFIICLSSVSPVSPLFLL